MLAPVPAKRGDGGSSFGTLGRYLVESVSAETGEVVQRGEVYTSDNILSVETAATEMKAVAAENKRVKDPVFHYVLSWRPDEQPTGEQWREAVRHSVNEIGLSEHQFMAVAHTDTEVFHVHVMANRVHPETYQAWGAEFYKKGLDKSIREIEAKQGWQHSNGLYRWDEDAGIAVPMTRAEREQFRAENLGTTRLVSGRSEKMERYANAESLEGYIKRNVRAEVSVAIKRNGAIWMDVHSVMERHGLELVRGEKGGFTVRAKGDDGQIIAVKASDALREHFKGKAERTATDTKLGPWEPRPAFLGHAVEATQTYSPHREPARDPRERVEAREERAKGRQALDARFRAEVGKHRGAVRATERRLYQAGWPAAREAAAAERAKIRAARLPPAAKQAMRSVITAELLNAREGLRQWSREKALTELGAAPTKREWVADRAREGDAAALAQLRGWAYQDQRTAKAIERAGQGFGMQPGSEKVSHAVTAPHDAVAKVRGDAKRPLTLAWNVNVRTGSVTYTVNGKDGFIDHGSRCTLRNASAAKDADSIEATLKFAAMKYGSSNVVLHGDDEFKKRAIAVAVVRNVPVTFADKEQEQMRQQLIAAREMQRGKVPEKAHGKQAEQEKQEQDQPPRKPDRGLSR